MATMPFIKFYINSHVIVLTPQDPVMEVPEELPPDECTLTEEEFCEILPRAEDYITEFGAEMARYEEYCREHGL